MCSKLLSQKAAGWASTIIQQWSPLNRFLDYTPKKPPGTTVQPCDCDSTSPTVVTSADCQIGFCHSAISEHMIHSNTVLNLFVTGSLSQPHCSDCLIWPWNHTEARFRECVCLAFSLVAHFKEASRLIRVWVTTKNKQITSLLVFVFMRGVYKVSLFV